MKTMSFWRGNLKWLTALLVMLALAGCDSGSGSSSKAQPWVLKDAVDWYNHACSEPVLQFVIPVTLNDDNDEDFIVHYWCENAAGTAATTPTADALVAYLSQGGGQYSAETTAVFGETEPGLGGASRKYVRGDINGDGRDDFAFAMNWEDGRSTANPAEIGTQGSVLLSTAAGQYRVHRLGDKEWGHAVELVPNQAGGMDVIFSGFVNGVDALQAFRYQNGSWLKVSDEYPQGDEVKSWSNAFRYLQDADQRGYLVGVIKDNEKVGLALYSRETSGWVSQHRNETDIKFMTWWYNWSNTQEPIAVVEMDGQDYFSGSVDEICVLDNGVETPRLVAKQNATQHVQYKTLEQNPAEIYDQDDTRNVNLLRFYSIKDNQLVLEASPIVDEVVNVNYNFFDCRDINADQHKDLVVYGFSRPGFNQRVKEAGKPIVYLNDGQGAYREVKLDFLRAHSSRLADGTGPELQGVMWDVNKDGYQDLILFGSKTDQGGGNIEIQLLDRHLSL